MDLLLRSDRKYRKILRGLRQAKAGSCRKLEMLLRNDSYRKVLSGMRKAQAGGKQCVDLLLRRSEQGQILLGMRQSKACRFLNKRILCLSGNGRAHLS